MIPAPLPSRPGVRPPGGTAEGRERPREAQPPAAGQRALTQSTLDPALATCSHPARRAGGASFSPQPSFPALAFPGARGAAAAKAKAGGGAQEEPGSLARPLTRRPAAAARVPPSAVGGRSPAPASETSGAVARAQGGSEWGTRLWCVRPSVCSVGLSRSGSGAAPRLLAGFRAMGGRQATNGDPAGGLAARPTHLQAA